MNTHPEQGAAIFCCSCLGSSWGFGALLKGTSVMVLRVERALYIYFPHLQSLPDLRFEPTTFGLQVRLSNHWATTSPFFFKTFISFYTPSVTQKYLLFSGGKKKVPFANSSYQVLNVVHFMKFSTWSINCFREKWTGKIDDSNVNGMNSFEWVSDTIFVMDVGSQWVHSFNVSLL